MVEFTPLPVGPFSAIIADPPWAYGDKLPGPGRGAAKHYATLNLDEIMSLPVAEAAATDAHLYLWTTNAFMEQAFEVARAWGFTQKTILTWVKVKKYAERPYNEDEIRIGMGHYFRNVTEHVLFCTRGRLPPRNRSLPTAFMAPLGKHSEKPDEFYSLVRKLSPSPRLDLFARRERKGFTTWGEGI